MGPSFACEDNRKDSGQEIWFFRPKLSPKGRTAASFLCQHNGRKFHQYFLKGRERETELDRAKLWILSAFFAFSRRKLIILSEKRFPKDNNDLKIVLGICVIRASKNVLQSAWKFCGHSSNKGQSMTKTMKLMYAILHSSSIKTSKDTALFGCRVWVTFIRSIFYAKDTLLLTFPFFARWTMFLPSLLF